jgi:hypothetical protein
VQGRGNKFNVLKQEILNHSQNDRYIESLDRIHTLFQDYLIQICIDLDIEGFNNQEQPVALLNRIKSRRLEDEVIENNSFIEKTI